MRVAACAILVSAALALTSASADPVDDYVRSQLQPRKVPGLSLAVVQNGRIVKAQGYGVASLELRVPATERTVYEIGSISKQITANAVLLLVEDGRLQLDDRLAEHLEGLPPAWSGITIRHVLTHTAGLPDFDTGGIGFSYRREYTSAEFVELLAKHPLKFAPGEQWNYVNAFPLLGMIIERVTGAPYTTFVEHRIFKALGLASARFKRDGDVIPDRAAGYLFTQGQWRHGEILRPAIIAANGGVMMNVVDFARWDIAVTSGRLLRADSLRAMTSPVRLNSGRTVSHGLGWFMDQFNGHRFGAHWGTTVTGHSAVIRRYIDDGVTVIVLANLNDDGLAVDAISKHIANSYVPGVVIHGLTPAADQKTPETARVRAALTAVAEGADHTDAPGLASRLPEPVRQRLGNAVRPATAFELLGEEKLGASHFNLDPAAVLVRRYRATTPEGRRYLSVRVSESGAILGVLIEE